MRLKKVSKRRAVLGLFLLAILTVSSFFVGLNITTERTKEGRIVSLSTVRENNSTVSYIRFAGDESNELYKYQRELPRTVVGNNFSVTYNPDTNIISKISRIIP